MRKMLERVIAWLAMAGAACAQIGGEGFGGGPVSQFYNDVPYESVLGATAQLKYWSTNPAVSSVAMGTNMVNRTGSGQTGIGFDSGGRVGINTNLSNALVGTAFGVKPVGVAGVFRGFSPTNDITNIELGNASGGTYLQMISPTGGLGFVVQTYDKSYLLGSKLGLDTTAPDATLDVNGNAIVRGAQTNLGTMIVTGAVRLATSGALVGIGTNIPARALTIYRASDPYIQLANSTSGADTGDGFQLQYDTTNAYIWNYENGSMRFGINNNEKMRISGSNVGIGTNDPVSTLHVNGSVKVEGAQTNLGTLNVQGVMTVSNVYHALGSWDVWPMRNTVTGQATGTNIFIQYVFEPTVPGGGSSNGYIAVICTNDWTWMSPTNKYTNTYWLLAN